MKKIPTLFVRTFDERHKVTVHDEITTGCEWALTEEGIPTRKWDGSCCAIIDGVFYKRYDAKKGKPIPEGAIPCQDVADAVTGHLPCWVRVTDDPANKWFIRAYEESGFTADGTYEAVGPHFNNNPDGFENDTLVRHGDTVLELEDKSLSGVISFLENNNIEGIVFHRANGEMCKIKRSDFGIPWAKKRR